MISDDTVDFEGFECKDYMWLEHSLGNVKLMISKLIT